MCPFSFFCRYGLNASAIKTAELQPTDSGLIIHGVLEEVLSESDIISLNMPLNDSTRGFISADKIALMKPTAVFINCARGPIVDNAALAKALNEDKLGFAYT